MHACACVCPCVFVHVCVCAYVLKKCRAGRHRGIVVGWAMASQGLVYMWAETGFAFRSASQDLLPLTRALKLPPKQSFSPSFRFLIYQRVIVSAPSLTCMDSQIIARGSGNSKGNRNPSKKSNDLQVELSWVQHKREPGTGANWEVQAPCKASQFH